MAQAPELYTALSIVDEMTRSDKETIVPKTAVLCMEETIVTQSGLDAAYYVLEYSVYSVIICIK
jgi:hypothetical protein